MTQENDTETLLSLIQSYPELYTNGPINLNKKEIAWRKIKETTGLDVQYMKKKWKNLRDTYIKYKRSQLPGVLLKQKNLANWVWADKMTFMDSHRFKSNEKVTNVPSTTTDIKETENETEDKTPKEKLKDENTKKTTKRRKPIHNHQCSTKKAKKTVTPIEKPVNIECDRLDMEFLGYANTVKNFSLSKQAVIKLQITNIITQAQLQECGETIPDETSACSYLYEFDDETMKPTGSGEMKVEIVDDPLETDIDDSD